MKIYKIAWCFKFKTNRKVLQFNYRLKNYNGPFSTKKVVKKRVLWK